MQVVSARASAEKFPGWQRKKKDQKIALLSFFQEGGGAQREKDRKIAREKISTIKPLCTTCVPCMKNYFYLCLGFLWHKNNIRITKHTDTDLKRSI